MQDIGGGDAGSDADGDADSDVDSDTDSDTDFDVYGYVNLAQRTEDVIAGGRLALSAAFYEVPYDPSTADWVESRTTPDGVECDIFYHSGMPPDPEDQPPEQVDGGAIRVGEDGPPEPDVLEVEFDGEAYTTDYRTQWDWQNPLPGWLVQAPFFVDFVGDGHGPVAAFSEELLVSPIPELSPDSPSGIDEMGNYLWEWSGNGAEEVVFSLHFNMDWDDASFVCPVDPGIEQIQIPEGWIDEYSWGSGEVALYSRDRLEVEAGGGLVRLNVTRAHTVQFVTASD